MRKTPTEFKQLLYYHNITVADISRYSGIAYSTIKGWMDGTYKPNLKDVTYDKIIQAYERLKRGKY